MCDTSKTKRNGYHGAPDLIIEIWGPSTSKKDTDIKYSLYEEAWVKEYWIVHPTEQTVLVYHLQDGKYVTTGKLLSSGDELKSGIGGMLILEMRFLRRR